MEQSTVDGVVRRIRYRDDSSGFTIAVLEDGMSIKGNFAFPIMEGERYEFRGKPGRHPRFGPFLEATVGRQVKPVTMEGIALYLEKHAPGVGEKIAASIVEKFFEETLDVCRDEPEKLIHIKGISPERAMLISQALKQIKGNEDAEVELRGMLKDLRWPNNVLVAILRKHGIAAPTVVRSNPYSLIEEFRGVSWQRADDLAMRLGIPRDSPDRVEAGIMQAFTEAEREGDTAIRYNEAVGRCCNLLGLKAEMVEDGLMCVESPFDEILQIASLDEAESRIAGYLAAGSGSPPPLNVQPNVEGLNERQAKAVELAVKADRMLLIGGPGTGKSYTSRRIVDALVDSGLTVALCAPTGKAAKRLAEATGRMARTIHRTLGTEYDGNTFRFAHDEHNPLDYGAVLVDEVSMVDARLMSSLVRALKPETRLVLVGDSDQLPSVGPGQVLRDVMPYVPTVELEEVMRTDSPDIIGTCAAMRTGDLYQWSKNGDVRHVSTEGRGFSESVNLVARIAFTELPSRPENVGFKTIDPVRDIMVLVPTNKACDDINAWVQECLHGRSYRQGERIKPMVHDKVIQTRNDYENGIFNGDIGYVRHIDDKRNVTVDFDGRRVTVPKNNDLRVAYAITIHKSQGSESPIVVCLFHKSNTFMLNRNLMYTAISRAQKLCVVVGDRGVMKRAISKQVRRLTTLARRLKEAQS